SRPLQDISVQKQILQLFNQNGIAQSRLFLTGQVRSISQHLSLYNQVDIALDPFPYNGTTTTCEALVMGIPVLTIEGFNHAGRVSKSLLWSVGLSDWIANNKSDFFYKAQALTKEINVLVQLRLYLREIMLQAKICNSIGHTKKIETTFTRIWQKKCMTIRKNSAFLLKEIQGIADK
ncbi:MAG: hypothetical protein HQK75_17650, partial [Candidatus Magnetomorum sp.]|nr:hypothetical protein [Candidatus Magnetomorum sp.]